jgi:hypothetical protein
VGWVTFYWHWKHLAIWSGNVAQFNESSTYLMGWFRDYLWLNSSQLINGLQPVRQQQPRRLGLDVPVRSPGVGHWLHVPDLLAWLLAGTD